MEQSLGSRQSSLLKAFHRYKVFTSRKLLRQRWRKGSLRVFLAISAILGIIVYQVDIVGAYLESLLDDNKFSIYTKQPSGMHQLRQIREGLLCRLLKSLYGLKQSGLL